MNSCRSSSSSSSGSSTSSGSSSCSDTGSSSSDSESSSSPDDKSTNNARTREEKAKSSQGVVRRKSSEFKAPAVKMVDPEKPAPKSRAANGVVGQRQTRAFTYSSEDDTPPTKKTVRASGGNASAVAQRRKNSGGGGGESFALTNSKLQKPQQEPSTSATNKNTNLKQISDSTVESKERAVHLSAASDESEKDLPVRKPKSDAPKTSTTKASAVNAANAENSLKSKMPPKRSNTSQKTALARRKSSDESEYDSATGSDEDESSTSSETESSGSSYSSKIGKGNKNKRNNNKATHSDSDDCQLAKQDFATRKLTRSLSTRRSKQQAKSTAGADFGSESDSDGLAEHRADKKHSLSKSPAKKAYVGGGINKCKVKKEGGGGSLPPMARALSPPQQQMEKKCPIEGCDSSGHLSGNHDRHFLPEACPIYHNMSVSECKERANERKLRNELRCKTSINSNSIDCHTSTPIGGPSCPKQTPSPEQREFIAKIRESRARFRPIAEVVNSDKVKLEKDCTDEDREPSLVGLVPDYDLQLFRDAQALASEKIEEELKDLPIGKGIKYITMGKYKMKVWYQSPYPDDAARLPKMYICEFCLRYQKSETGIKRHAKKCVWRHPPGDEIYRKGKLQVWQVDGKRHKQYCQHLCLLAKFFLDHKTLYYDVEPFLFYIMTLADVDGCHTVGYFSKEKNSFYNVSCILTLPPYQRKGYGRLLIDFSYLLTRVEGKIGSPEKPLSDLGLISYRSYWKDVLLDYLCNRSGNTLSIKDVSQEMAIYSYDIVSTLQALGMMKYWKGKHIVLKKQDVLDEYEERVKRRGTFPKIDDTCLRWIPFVPAQTTDSP